MAEDMRLRRPRPSLLFVTALALVASACMTTSGTSAASQGTEVPTSEYCTATQLRVVPSYYDIDTSIRLAITNHAERACYLSERFDGILRSSYGVGIATYFAEVASLPYQAFSSYHQGDLDRPPGTVIPVLASQPMSGKIMLMRSMSEQELRKYQIKLNQLAPVARLFELKPGQTAYIDFAVDPTEGSFYGGPDGPPVAPIPDDPVVPSALQELCYARTVFRDAASVDLEFYYGRRAILEPLVAPGYSSHLDAQIRYFYPEPPLGGPARVGDRRPTYVVGPPRFGVQVDRLAHIAAFKIGTPQLVINLGSGILAPLANAQSWCEVDGLNIMATDLSFSEDSMFHYFPGPLLS